MHWLILFLFNLAAKIDNYYKAVAEHKEIIRAIRSLQGSLIYLKSDVKKLLEVSESKLYKGFDWAEITHIQIRI